MSEDDLREPRRGRGSLGWQRGMGPEGASCRMTVEEEARPSETRALMALL